MHLEFRFANVRHRTSSKSRTCTKRSLPLIFEVTAWTGTTLPTTLAISTPILLRKNEPVATRRDTKRKSSKRVWSRSARIFQLPHAPRSARPQAWTFWIRISKISRTRPSGMLSSAQSTRRSQKMPNGSRVVVASSGDTTRASAAPPAASSLESPSTRRTRTIDS